jgi:hypothetical protein
MDRANGKNILILIKRKKIKRIGHTMNKNSLLKHVIEERWKERWQ